jgi:hypothetical protein
MDALPFPDRIIPGQIDCEALAFVGHNERPHPVSCSPVSGEIIDGTIDPAKDAELLERSAAIKIKVGAATLTTM